MSYTNIYYKLHLSITLTWTRPKVDGGNPISGYVIEKKEKGTDKWIP